MRVTRSSKSRRRRVTNKRRDKKTFSQTAMHVDGANRASVARGGIRL